MISAREFALRAHGDQKYGDVPYIVHLDEVAQITWTMARLPTLETIAYLHNVLEDTSVTYEELKATFGHQVSNAVRLVTDEPGPNPQEREKLTYKKLANALSCKITDGMALAVKLASRLANVRRCMVQNNQARMDAYREEHEEFRKAVYRDTLWLIEHHARVQDELDILLGFKIPTLQERLTLYLARERPETNIAREVIGYVSKPLGLDGLVLQKPQEIELTEILLLCVAEYLDALGVSREHTADSTADSTADTQTHTIRVQNHREPGDDC